jgi:hypothetical protein
MTNETEALRVKIREAEAAGWKALKQAEEDAERELYNVQKEYEEYLTETQEKIRSAEALTEDERRKNRNLIRILKERANAQRGLTPKKDHPGYIILSVEEYTYIHRETNGGFSHNSETGYLPCWKVRLQTPYSATADHSNVVSMNTDDLLNSLGGLMGISSLHDISAEGISAVKELFKAHRNLIFKMSFKLNAAKGFWEVEYLTTKFIAVTPDMLTCGLEKRKTGN